MWMRGLRKVGAEVDGGKECVAFNSVSVTSGGQSISIMMDAASLAVLPLIFHLP